MLNKKETILLVVVVCVILALGLGLGIGLGRKKHNVVVPTPTPTPTPATPPPSSPSCLNICKKRDPTIPPDMCPCVAGCYTEAKCPCDKFNKTFPPNTCDIKKGVPVGPLQNKLMKCVTKCAS